MLGRASAIKVSAAIVALELVRIVVVPAGKLVRAGRRPAIGRRKAVQLRVREVRNPIGRRDGRRIAEHLEPVIPDRPPVCATAEEGRGSLAEAIERLRSTAVAASAVVEGVAAEVAVVDVAPISG